MNYTQLVATIQDYTENQFTTAMVDTFIQQAEQRIYNTVQLPALRKNVTGTTTSGNKYLAIPNDWLATFSLAVINNDNEYLYLLNKDVNFIRQSYPDTDSDFYGEPAYYAVFDQNTFILGPTPDANYNVELHYFYYPQSIVTANNTWLGDNFSPALLYGALLEAYTYMKGEADVIAQYQKRYDEALILLKQLGDAKNRMDAYRDGQVRYPVQ
jgi:hypothetical protein